MLMLRLVMEALLGILEAVELLGVGRGKGFVGILKRTLSVTAAIVMLR